MRPPIKWLGGKRKEIKCFKEYIPEFETYVEPFAGGAALYWELNPPNSHLNDVNEYLMNFYKCTKDNYDELHKLLQTYVNTKEEFYNVVHRLNEHISGEKNIECIELAAIFYYLNRTAFGGKWRVNSKGFFNTSYGSYKTDTYKNLDKRYSDTLTKTKLTNVDYTEVLNTYRNDGDAFIFLDPPYLDCDTMYVKTQKFQGIYSEIKQYMDNTEAKVMMVVKDGSVIEEYFSDKIVCRYDKSYRIRALSDNKHEHVVITNY